MSAILGGLSPAKFLREHWQKKPLLVRQALPGFTGIVSPEAFLALAGRSDASSRLVLQHPRRKQRWERHDGPFEGLSAELLPRSHWTLLVHGVESLIPGGWELLRHFDFIPAARVDDLMLSYATDGGGVGPHDDRYDVFLLQGPGRRRWQLSQQRDRRLDPQAAIKVHADFRAEEEHLLEPGDMLYLPPDVAHFGVAEGDCFTYSIGFLAPSHADLIDGFLSFLAGRADPGKLYTDPELAVQKDPLELGDAMVDKVRAVVDGIRWDAADVEDFLGRFLTRPKPHVRFALPARPMGLEAFARRLGARRGRVALALPSRGLVRGRTLFLNGLAHVLPAKLLRVARALLRERQLALPVDDTAAELLHDWYLAGFLVVLGAAR